MRNRAMVVASGVVLGVVLGVTPVRSQPAAPRFDKVVIDRVDVQTSPIAGMNRVRALVSATELRGARIPIPGEIGGKKQGLVAKVGTAKPPLLTGYLENADAELDLVIMIPTSIEYEVEYDAFKQAIDGSLLTPLDKLGSRVRVKIVGYGESTTGSKNLGSIESAHKALAGLMTDASSTAETDYIALLSTEIKKLKNAVKKPHNAGAIPHAVIVFISSGLMHIGDDNKPGLFDDELKKKITEIAEEANKAEVRIDTIGYNRTTQDARRPLLALGELSRWSQGTFRWVRAQGAWDGPLGQLAEELRWEYVVTFWATPDDLENKKLVVTIPFGGDLLESDGMKIGEPKCGKETCSASAYCVAEVCVTRRLQSGGSTVASVLLIGGIGAGALVLFIGVGALIARMRKPKAAPLPMATAVKGGAPGVPMGTMTGGPQGVGMPGGFAPAGPAPPPAQATTGPMLIILTGPQSGSRLALHHGFSVGKAPGSNLDLSHDSFASGSHAQIVIENGAWMLYDRGSTNGTFSNGVRISQTRLDSGMTIRFGSTDVRFWVQQ